MPGVLLQQGDFGLLYLLLDAVGPGAVVAGARDRVLDLLVVAVEPVVRVGELRHPPGAGPVEDNRDLVAGILELLGRRQSVRYPPQISLYPATSATCRYLMPLRSIQCCPRL